MNETCRVVAASVRAFDCAFARYTSEPFALGQMLAVREGRYLTFGVVTGSESGPDDPSRPLVPRGDPGQSAAAVMAGNPEIELLLRTTLEVAVCGHIDREVARPVLPPMPPPLLAEVHAASDEEKVRIAEEGRFLVPLLANPAADDAVVAAAIREVARAAGPEGRSFLVAAGKELARLLKAEPSRLTSILRAVDDERREPDPARPLGVVVGGFLTEGLEVRLDPGQTAQLGQYAKTEVEGGLSLLGMVTDITLKSVDSGPTVWPPGEADTPLLREVLQDTGVYTALAVDPYLELGENGEEPARARRLPSHFSAVHPADQDTLDRAFATDGPSIPVGAPLGMDKLEVGVDFERLFERSAGVFGKSGTGKSVLVLHLLDAMLTRSAAAPTNSERTVALVFDMHNDYGWEMKFQGPTTSRLRSLKQRHATDAELYTLESGAARSDGQILIGTRDIQPDDLEVLRETLDLSDLAIDAAHACRRRFGPGWIDEILADEPSSAVVDKLWRREPPEGDVNWSQVGAQMGYPGSLESLRRRMERLTRREFVRTEGSQFGDVIEHIVRSLQGGKSVIVQFGRFGNDLTSYMLVANMLSRRIWERYRDRTERSQEREAPNRLVIVIEEAHKFVDRSLAGQSVFGQIARELRKYNVTLLVIDQRPSQIDPEVLSQIGTKFTLQLDSDNDVDALVGNVAGRSGLRQVIAALESKRQALVFGHALPMPVVVQTPEATNADSARASLRARLGLPEREKTSPAAALFGAPAPPGDGP